MTTQRKQAFINKIWISLIPLFIGLLSVAAAYGKLSNTVETHTALLKAQATDMQLARDKQVRIDANCIFIREALTELKTDLKDIQKDIKDIKRK